MIFIDSNVLIAGANEDHDDFAASDALLTEVRNNKRALTAAHALVETYAVLTGQPKPKRFSPAQAVKYVARLAEFIPPYALETGDVLAFIDGLAGSGVAGGRVYDALHARTAAKAGARTIVTWNEKHFIGLDPSIEAMSPDKALARD